MESPSARAIVAALKGKWCGGRGVCRCPAHDDRTPSLSVTQRGSIVLLHCHAGCPQMVVIGALQDIGLWPHRNEIPHPSYPHHTFKRNIEDDSRRIAFARSIWDQGISITGTIAETYLNNRALRFRRWHDCLRFHPHLLHRNTGKHFPALLAAIENDEGISAVQRTWLMEDGSWKAEISPPKATFGPMFDGAVRLATTQTTLGLAEGVETALSVQKIYSVPCWAVLGAHRLQTVAIPTGIETLLIFADSGEVGLSCAREAVRRHTTKSRTVQIVQAENDDYNCLLMETTSSCTSPRVNKNNQSSHSSALISASGITETFLPADGWCQEFY